MAIFSGDDRSQAKGRGGSRAGSALVADALAADRLGPSALVIFTVSAATPLTVVAGVVTTGYATTGVRGIPVAFVVVGLMLAVFAVGYVAMARRIANAGAFYAYIAQGLSRRLAVGAAWLALVSYNLLQVGLYGVMGVAAAPVVEDLIGVVAPWWVFALVAWALTAVLGLLKVDVNGRVLGILLGAEVVLILVFSVADLASPATAGLSFATLAPSALFGPGLGAMLVLAVLGFVGFESAAVYSEETRDSDRSVRTATFVAIAMTGGLYAVSSWAMSVATGPSQIVAASQAQGPELVFTLAAERLGEPAAQIGHALFVTSIAAALISFHNTTARYAFALGRERVLPAGLGTTSTRTGAPAVASVAQSVIGLSVITGYAVLGLDPLVQLFYYAGTAGGIGVLTLLLLTAIAVFWFFTGTEQPEDTWSAYVAPALSALLLLGTLAVALTNLDTLFGVPGGHWLTWSVPVGIITILVLGALWGARLRVRRPDVFAVIGLGPQSSAARAKALVNAVINR